MKHPNELTISDYLDGTLSPTIMDEIGSHLIKCGACSTKLTAMHRFEEQLTKTSSPLAPISDIWTSIKPHLPLPADGLVETSQAMTPITPEYLADLQEAIALRDFDLIQTLIDEHLPTLATFDFRQEGAPRLLALLARWIDMGFGYRGDELDCIYHLKRALKLFPEPIGRRATFGDVADFHLAYGILRLHQDDFDEAISHFGLVYSLKDHLRDDETIAVACHGLAKANEEQGKYREARQWVTQASELAAIAKRPELKAAFQVLLGWLLFQEDDDSAESVLTEAYGLFKGTDDVVQLGHILSILGRISQRAGNYKYSIKLFSEALTFYSSIDMGGGRSHPHVARTLANRAFARRLEALRCDRAATGERPLYLRSYANPIYNTNPVASAAKLRDDAHSDLAASFGIYDEYDHSLGRCLVFEARAYLKLDAGELDLACQLARDAVHEATQACDDIKLAGTLILQCIAECALAVTSSSDIAKSGEHAEMAYRAITQAIASAERTQHRRVNCRARIWRGMVLLLPFYADLTTAKQCYEQAVSSLPVLGNDYIREELLVLQSRIESASKLERRVECSRTGGQA